MQHTAIFHLISRVFDNYMKNGAEFSSFRPRGSFKISPIVRRRLKVAFVHRQLELNFFRFPECFNMQSTGLTGHYVSNWLLATLLFCCSSIKNGSMTLTAVGFPCYDRIIPCFLSDDGFFMPRKRKYPFHDTILSERGGVGGMTHYHTISFQFPPLAFPPVNNQSPRQRTKLFIDVCSFALGKSTNRQVAIVT
jgi:hypothetical protein